MIPEKFRRGKYAGNKWGGKFLRAPDIFFTILEKGKGKLVKVQDVPTIKVNYGIKSGAIEFFNLTKDLIKKYKIESQFYKPVITSLKETPSILVDKKKLKFNLLYVNKKKNELKNTNVLKYIEEGENKGFNKRPSCRGNNPWYNLTTNKEFLIVYSRMVGERYLCLLNKQKFLVTDNFIGISLSGADDVYFVCSYLNSTLAHLLNLQYGAWLTGAYNVVRMDTFKLKQIPLLTFNTDKKIKQKLIYSLKKMINREIKTVFNELNIDPSKPIREQEPKPLPDRAELDKIIFDELGLTKEERKEVYWAVAELVKQRLEKAKSLGKRATFNKRR